MHRSLRVKKEKKTAASEKSRKAARPTKGREGRGRVKQNGSRKGINKGRKSKAHNFSATTSSIH